MVLVKLIEGSLNPKVEVKKKWIKGSSINGDKYEGF